jgi:hypothetical protein
MYVFLNFVVVEAMFSLSGHMCQLFNIDILSCLTLHLKFSQFYAFLIVYFKKQEEKVLRGYDRRVTQLFRMNSQLTFSLIYWKIS